jgi:cell division protein FtsN
MGRRDYKNARRPQAETAAAKPRRGSGLMTGLFLGVIVGMAVAGGLYWYLNSQPSGLKTIEPAPTLAPPKAPRAADTPPEPAPAKLPDAPPAKPAAAPSKPDEVSRTAPEKAQPVAPKAKPEATRPPPADYSFYDILPGKVAAKPAQPVKPKEHYWLQVAALKSATDADGLKARLKLLGLPVVVQKIALGETPLHRVRVGPFKSEDDGLEALDTLAENDFEPRWVKDPVTP